MTANRSEKCTSHLFPSLPWAQEVAGWGAEMLAQVTEDFIVAPDGTLAGE